MDISSIEKAAIRATEIVKLDKHQLKTKVATELVNRIHKHKSRFSMFSL